MLLMTMILPYLLLEAFCDVGDKSNYEFSSYFFNAEGVCS